MIVEEAIKNIVYEYTHKENKKLEDTMFELNQGLEIIGVFSNATVILSSENGLLTSKIFSNNIITFNKNLVLPREDEM